MNIRPIRFIGTAALGMALVSGCTQQGQSADERSPEMEQLLVALGDSVDHLVPTAISQVKKAMAQTTDSLDYYDLLQLCGHACMLSATPDSALPYCQQVRRFVSQQRSTPRVNGLHAAALNTEASYYYLMHTQYDTAIDLYSEAYNLLAHSDTKDKMPDVEANLADVYVAMNNLPQGASHYRHALLLTDSLQLPRERNITLYMGLANIYTKLNAYDDAQSIYQKTDSLFMEMRPNMQSYFLNNYGSCLYLKGDYQQALSIFQRMRQLLEQYGLQENFDMYLCKINMADVLLNLGRLEEAERCVDESALYFAANGVDIGVYYANTIRMGIAMQRGQLGLVEQILKGEQLASQPEFLMQTIRNRYLVDYYVSMGQYANAYHQLKQNVALNDSAEHNVNNMKATEIMMRFTQDTLQLHHQLAIEERNNAIYRTRTLSIFLIGLALILSLAVIGALLYVRKRRMQNMMNVMFLKLENARNRISPHFVFNLLNNKISHSNPQEADALMQLAKLIRANLDISSKSVITLKDELDFVRQYIEVEAPLLGEDFSYSINTPDEVVLASIRVPSMTVQILVENALVHALKEVEGGKRLAISVKADGKGTTITVADNGPGFDIRRHDCSRQSHNGLRIITHTLQLVNSVNSEGHRIRFNIGNASEGGCTAQLYIPQGVKYIES